ncbi:hypothetical protein CJ199_00420 [Brevibacterium paucivorans]|uniref:Uncharacterized protein n=2 Tax=Brevibacterium paucivorans TaxID=170994 RepID=A0A2N6VP39_9MICO|nr:hypothetical protein CJ199_00420 [Brevibacterium paucivorans]
MMAHKDSKIYYVAMLVGDAIGLVVGIAVALIADLNVPVCAGYGLALGAGIGLAFAFASKGKSTKAGTDAPPESDATPKAGA